MIIEIMLEFIETLAEVFTKVISGSLVNMLDWCEFLEVTEFFVPFIPLWVSSFSNKTALVPSTLQLWIPVLEMNCL